MNQAGIEAVIAAIKTYTPEIKTVVADAAPVIQELDPEVQTLMAETRHFASIVLKRIQAIPAEVEHGFGDLAAEIEKVIGGSK